MFALFFVGILLSTGFVSAYRGDMSVQGPNYGEERHELMQEAFENNDYNSWKELMIQDGRHPRVVNVITEDNFAQFAEIHNAKLSGDYEKVKELRAELGLGQGMRQGKGFSGNGSYRN